MDIDRIKADVRKRYDAEALQKDCERWYREGDDVRVPEKKSAHYFVGRKVREALRLGGASPDARVLEIGCSFGQMTALLARHYNNLTAVDLSEKSIMIARKRMEHYGLSKVSFKTADAENLHEFADCSMDRIYSFSTIRFCPQPARVLGEVYRVLDHGGIAVIDFPNRYSPWHLFIKASLSIRRHIHDTLYTPAQAQQLFRQTGFQDLRIKKFMFTSRRLPDALLPLTRIAESVLEHCGPLTNLAGIIMVKGVKP